MLEKKTVQTEHAPQAIGPYVQAQLVGDWVYLSGQIPLTAEGQLIGEDIESQTRQVLDNMQAVLQAADSDLEHVVKVTIFIQDMNEFGKINDIYGEYFVKSQPARSCVEVARLPKDVRIEMDCVALKHS